MTPAVAARAVLVACFVVLLFNSGARFAMGLMLYPMAQDLGWSRSTLSLTVTVFMLVSAGALPFVGRLVDLLGAGNVLAVSVAISVVGLASMGLIETPWQALLLYGVVFALGSAGTSITPIGVLLSRWYPHRMGMANSIAISGMGMGQLLIISVLASQLAQLGWRGSFVALGIATLLCVLPLVLATSRLRSPDAAPDGEGIGGEAVGAGRGARTLREALASRRLWLLLSIYAICGFQDFLVATHVVAFALDEGVDGLLAGNMLAFMGLAGLLGVLVSGALNDRFGPVPPTALCFLIRIVLCAVVLSSREPVAIVGAALLYGSTFWITAPLTVIFAREVSVAALLGTVSGLITMVHHSAGGLGALFGASIYDRYGSYHVAFVVLMGSSVVALCLTLLMARRPVASAA